MANNPVTPAVFGAGNDTAAKEIVMQLFHDAGFEPFDTGELANSRSIEQVSVVLHHVGTHEFSGSYRRLTPTLLQAQES